MKKILSIILISFVATSAMAQAPTFFSYQAVVRDGDGKLISEKPVGVQINILEKSEDGKVIYTETHAITANKNGLVTLKVGGGTVVLGDFININWGNGRYFLQTEIDPAGGKNYTVKNTSQVLSVPYALYANSAGGGWKLDGNSVSDKDFLGTTNNKPLVFKVNNARAGFIDVYNNKNTFLGLDAGVNNTGSGNTANGFSSMFANTTGSANVAVGINTLRQNTTGNYNVVTGAYALSSNTTGNFNTVSGSSAMASNTTGYSNVSIGANSLSKNTTGNDNTAIGDKAMKANTTGIYNVANGSMSLSSNTEGKNNVAVGYASMESTTTGSYNVASGANTLNSNTIGSHNVANGSGALSYNTTGEYNVANGSSALNQNTEGSYNVATGANALFTNSTGKNNVATGYQSLYRSTTGVNNTATGNQSMLNNTTGSDNVANGYYSMYSSTEGKNNVSIGTYSLYANDAGSFNVASGCYSMYNNVYGLYNVASGYKAFYGNTIGSYNVAIGNESLKTNEQGRKNVAIGALADVTGINLENATAIGYNAKVNASNKVRIGNTDVTKIEGQVAFSFPSDARFKYNIKSNVPGLDFIKKLQPVTYYFDNEKLDEFTKTGVLNNSNVYPVSYKGEKEIHTGFLAQDVEKTANELGYHFDGVRAPENDKDHYSIAYSQFIMPLVKGMQEQQMMIEKQEQKIEQLQSLIEKQDDIIKELQSFIKKQLNK